MARTKKGKLVEELLAINVRRSEMRPAEIRAAAVNALLDFIGDTEVRLTFLRVFERQWDTSSIDAMEQTAIGVRTS